MLLVWVCRSVDVRKSSGAEHSPGPYLLYPSPKEWHLINQSQIRLDSFSKITERTSNDSTYRSFHLPTCFFDVKLHHQGPGLVAYLPRSCWQDFCALSGSPDPSVGDAQVLDGVCALPEEDLPASIHMGQGILLALSLSEG